MPNHYPPGPKGHFLLGSIPEFMSNSFEACKQAATYGDVVHLRMLNKHVYLLHSPADIHHVLVESANKYYKDDLSKKALRPWVGNGLFINDGENWRKQRRLLQPAFHHKHYQGYMDIMAQKTNEMLSTWTPGEQFDLRSKITEAALGIVVKTLFGMEDISSITTDVGHALRTMVRIAGLEMRSVTLPDWLPIDYKLEKKEAIAHLHQVIENIIANHRDFRGTDLLSSLLDATDEQGEGMTPQELRDEVFMLLGGGQETTSTTLTWLFYALGRHTRVREKVWEEVDRVVGDKPLTFEMLPQLVYLDWVIKETMRHYAISWLLSRQAIEDDIIGGYPIKKGDLVMINIYMIHHDERFYDAPDDFIPERWGSDFEKNLPKGAFLPFGGGPRICIGQQFGLLEAKVMASIIASRFHLITTTKDIPPRGEGTLLPSIPILATVEPRHVRYHEDENKVEAIVSRP